MNSLFDIKGKVIIVTGATGVLAGATAKYLAQNGAKVAFLGRNKEKLDEARKFCESNGLCGMACECDVLNRSALESVREKVLGEWGTIDAIVNGAGGNQAGAVIQPDQSFFDLDVDAWNSVFKLNLQGTILPIIVFTSIIWRRLSREVCINALISCSPDIQKSASISFSEYSGSSV